MGWYRLRRLAAISLTVGVVSGCGEAAVIGSVSDTGSSSPAAPKQSDPTLSVAYCQLRDNGEWVTNDRANSTSPCVPDPSHATGDEPADASVAIPRCYTCKLSDWKRAERRAAVQSGEAAAASMVATTATDTNHWSRDARSRFLSDCGASLDGSLCECLANHLERGVRPDQAEGLSAEDPRVKLAARYCRS